MFFWYVTIIILIVVFINELYTFKTGVQTTASFPNARKIIAQRLHIEKERAQTTRPFSVVDLGSGNGQLAQRIAHELPEASVVGVEFSFVPWAFSTLRQKIFGPHNLTFIRKDFWSYDISEHDAVVLFLTDNVIQRMSEKLTNELPAGRLIISNETALSGDWTPIEIIDLPFWKSKVFVYRR